MVEAAVKDETPCVITYVAVQVDESSPTEQAPDLSQSPVHDVQNVLCHDHNYKPVENTNVLPTTIVSHLDRNIDDQKKIKTNTAQFGGFVHIMEEFSATSLTE